MQFTYLTSFVTVFTTSSFFLFLLSPFLLFSFFVCKRGNKNVHFMLTSRVLTFFFDLFFFEFLIPIQLPVDLNSILDPTKSFTKPSKLFRQKNEILHFLGRKMKFNVNSQLNIRNKAVKLIYKLSK